MQKWEYAYITLIAGKCVFGHFKQSSKPVEVADALSTVEKLGLDGWELVAVNSVDHSLSYVFKRPKAAHQQQFKPPQVTQH